MSDTPRDRVVTLRSPELEVEVVPEGASIRSLRLAGVERSLVVGAADLAIYGAANRSFLGASIGRYANRIAGGRLSVGEAVHALSVNEPPHHLHGGVTGFWSRPWRVEDVREDAVLLSLVSPDGEDGYPGEARVTARIALQANGTLAIEYRGTVDRPSVMNLTAHLYFNLAATGSTRDHILTIAADSYLPVGADLIPLGAPAPVAGTPFDFRAGRRMADGPALLDHNFCLGAERLSEPRPVASLRDPASGVTLSLSSTECGLQVYDGHIFAGSPVGLDGETIPPYGGIALEPQLWPNAPNEPSYPSADVGPGTTYRHLSLYRFFRDGD